MLCIVLRLLRKSMQEQKIASIRGQPQPVFKSWKVCCDSSLFVVSCFCIFRGEEFGEYIHYTVITFCLSPGGLHYVACTRKRATKRLLVCVHGSIQRGVFTRRHLRVAAHSWRASRTHLYEHLQATGAADEPARVLESKIQGPALWCVIIRFFAYIYLFFDTRHVFPQYFIYLILADV